MRAFGRTVIGGRVVRHFQTGPAPMATVRVGAGVPFQVAMPAYSQVSTWPPTRPLQTATPIPKIAHVRVGDLVYDAPTTTDSAGDGSLIIDGMTPPTPPPVPNGAPPERDAAGTVVHVLLGDAFPVAVGVATVAGGVAGFLFGGSAIPVILGFLGGNVAGRLAATQATKMQADTAVGALPSSGMPGNPVEGFDHGYAFGRQEAMTLRETMAAYGQTEATRAIPDTVYRAGLAYQKGYEMGVRSLGASMDPTARTIRIRPANAVGS